MAFDVAPQWEYPVGQGEPPSIVVLAWAGFGMTLVLLELPRSIDDGSHDSEEVLLVGCNLFDNLLTEL